MMFEATYSVEDNKLRLYASARLDAELYAQVKALGFKWAPKQELFVAPSWTPSREDFLLGLCGEIGDEDYSPQERAADRAERFSNYRDKREDEALAKADKFNQGPQVFGNQSRDRAERQAKRADTTRRHAVTQWGKAEYWQRRTQGVIANALYKSSAEVRRGRLLRLESEQRKHAETGKQALALFNAWAKVSTLDGQSATWIEGSDDNTPAIRAAYHLANYAAHGWDYQHPRNPERKPTSLYSLLVDPVDPITAEECAALALGDYDGPPCEEGTNWKRYADHLQHRIDYEKAMIAADGGMVADIEMEPGGWIGSHQIQGVTKSPKTGRVVSVKLFTKAQYWEGRDEGKPAPTIIKPFNIERLPAGAYRAPTDEERQQFAKSTKERKKAEKETKPKAASLINPTIEDAERLQEFLNAENARRFPQHGSPSKIARMSQAQYSAALKADRHAESAGITEKLTIDYSARSLAMSRTTRNIIFKVRTVSGGKLYATTRVVVIDDAKQKPLPWDEVDAARAKQPTEETIKAQRADVLAVLRKSSTSDMSKEEKQLLEDACYVGYAYWSSMSQFGLSDKGRAALMETAANVA
jgi:hypothetical protein